MWDCRLVLPSQFQLRAVGRLQQPPCWPDVTDETESAFGQRLHVRVPFLVLARDYHLPANGACRQQISLVLHPPLLQPPQRCQSVLHSAAIGLTLGSRTEQTL